MMESNLRIEGYSLDLEILERSSLLVTYKKL